MNLIDTHAHLCSEEFERDLGGVLERARREGVAAVIAVAENVQDAHRNLAISKEVPFVFPAAGIYPTILDIAQARKMHDFIRSNRHALVAIGEVGLDYWKVKDDEEREIQREIFKSFIRLSKEIELPLNVHSRSAGRQALEMLLREGAENVQMHAFDGKSSTAMLGVEAGYYFSIPPSIVRSRQKQKLVRQLPVTSLLSETDSPVLGPIPDKRNEPANVKVSVKVIAEIKGMKEEEVAEILYENACRLYRVDVLKSGMI